MSNTGLKSIIILLVLVQSYVVVVECTIQITITETLTSCTNPPLSLTPELPNLSHAKVNQQITVPNVTCNTVDMISGNLTYTWYYHSVYPPVGGCPDNQCCFDIATSVVGYTSVVRSSTASNAVITRAGSVLEGAYFGKNVTSVLLLPLASPLACATAPGLQINSGPDTLTITDGPICSGVEITELCPGIHFG